MYWNKFCKQIDSEWDVVLQIDQKNDWGGQTLKVSGETRETTKLADYHY